MIIQLTTDTDHVPVVEVIVTILNLITPSEEMCSKNRTSSVHKHSICSAARCCKHAAQACSADHS
jgi:hypothetical protein